MSKDVSLISGLYAGLYNNCQWKWRIRISLRFSHRIEKIAKYASTLAVQKRLYLTVSAVARSGRMSEEVCIMHNLWSIQRESGTALVISLLLVTAHSPSSRVVCME